MARLSSLSQDVKRGVARYGETVVAVALIVLALGVLYLRVLCGYTPLFTYYRWQPPAWEPAFASVQGLIYAVLAAVGLALIALEALDQSLSRWLRGVLASPHRTAWLVGLSAALLGSYIFQPGNLGSSDAAPHIAFPWAVLASVRAGQPFVFWSNYGYFGHPLLQFYSVTYYYLVAFVTTLIPNLYKAHEITLFALHIASAFPMYLYVRRLSDSRAAGFVAALVWSATFYRYHLIIILGKLTTAPFIALLPLEFYFIEQLLHSERARLRPAAGLALTLGAMIWTHKLYGSWAFAAGLLYALIAVSTSCKSWRIAAQRLGLAALALATGLLTALYEVLPTFAEKENTLVNTMTQGRFRLPVIALRDVMNFRETLFTDWFGGFVGNTILALASVAVLALIARQWQKAYPLIGLLAGSLFMVFAPAYAPGVFDAVFHALPLGQLAYVSDTSPGMYLMMVIGPLVVLVGLLVAVGSEWIGTLAARHPRLARHITWERLAIVIITLVLAEAVPATLAVNMKLPDNLFADKPGRLNLLEYLAAHTTDPTARVVDADTDNSNYFLLSAYSGQPGLVSDIPDAPPAADANARRIMQALATELPTGRLSLTSTHLLAQLHIGYIITGSSASEIEGLTLLTRNADAGLWQVKLRAPVAAATTLASDFLDPAVNVPVTLTAHSLTATTVELHFTLTQPAFVQVAYTAYPYQAATLDGRPIPRLTTPLGLIGFQAAAGDHILIVTPTLSPLRKATLIVGGAITLLALALFFFPPR